MKKVLSLLLFFIATTVHAQTALVKKAAQGLCTITTFDDQGGIHATTRGAFVGSESEVVAPWSAFEGAQRATVIDAAGKAHDVDVMLGVSEVYGLCLVRVKGKAPAGLTLTTSDNAPQKVWLIEYDIKKPAFRSIPVESSEKFNTTLNYLLFSDADVSGTDLDCALVNEQGQLLGLMQRPKNGGQAHSADARLIRDFSLNGLSVNDRTLRATGIRTALPADESQATVMLMLAAQSVDSTSYDAYVSDYISQFPSSTEGYKARAEQYINQCNLPQADVTYNQCVKSATDKAEANYLYASAVYRSVAFSVDTTYTRWTYARAQQLIAQALQLNPLPLYKHLQAQITYAQGNYDEALNLFTELQQTDMGKNGEVYYEAAQCKMLQQAPQQEIEELLTQAINVQPGVPSAPYVLARATYLDNLGEYRKAFLDYVAYDTLMQYRATHDFYYTKYRCEMKIRQYQLALNDIAHAIVLNRYEPTYYAEMASLQLQVGKKDDAIATCNLAFNITDQYADLYIIKGVAQCELGNTDDGIVTLEKAKNLDDDRAAPLIEKYSKK